MGKTILITGGAGFLGGHLSDRLIECGHKVRILDNFISDSRGNAFPVPNYINSGVNLFRGDMREEKSLENALSKVDVVFHLATLKGSAYSMREFYPFVENNVLGAANLLKNVITKRSSVEKIILVSSTSCYGEGTYLCRECGVVYPPARKEEEMIKGNWEQYCPYCACPVEPLPTPEHKPTSYSSFYSLTLRQMEEISMLTGQTYAIPTVILRLSKVFGPRQSLKPRSGNFISTALHHLLHNEPPRIHEDGLQTRDFLSVQDATRAMLIAMDREAADCQVFNIGSGTPRTLREVSAILASRLEVEFQPLISGVFRPYSARHLHPDTTKAKLMLKFSAESDFEKTLGEAVEWYRTVIRERNNSSEGLKPGELSVH